MSAHLTLNDVCEFIVDSEHKTAEIQKTGYPYIRTPNIGKGRLDYSNVRRVGQEAYEQWTRRATPQKDDLILAREAPVGNVAIVPEGEKVCLGQRTVLLRPNQKLVDPEYLTYLLLGNEIQGTFQSVSNGATVKHLNLKDIRSLVLPILPDLSAQRAQGQLIANYDYLSENNNRRIAILEDMAQSLYREWFVNFRFPGHENCEFKDTSLGEIPEGWDIVSLEEISERITDGAHKSPKSVGSGVPMASVKDMHDFGINEGKCRRISEDDYLELLRQDSVVKANDILVAKDGSYLKHTFVVEKDQKMALLSSIAMIRANTRVKPHWLAYCLRSGVVKERMKQCVSGVAIPRIILKDFRKFKIFLPTEKLLIEWNDLVQPMVEECWSLIARNNNLKAQRDMLLPKLISGKIEV